MSKKCGQITRDRRVPVTPEQRTVLDDVVQQAIGQMRLQRLQRTLESMQPKTTVDRPYRTGKKTKSGIWVPSESDNRNPGVVAAMVAAQDARRNALDIQDLEEDSGSSDHHESA